MVDCYIALGSNLGDRTANVFKAIDLLKSNPKIEVEKISSLIETNPQGGPSQGKFLNQVLKIKTSLSAESLLEVIHNIENKLGRIRSIRNGPRTIDLDILLYADKEIRNASLKIPHPRMFDRLFVIMPLLEIEPDIFDKIEILKPYKNKIKKLVNESK